MGRNARTLCTFCDLVRIKCRLILAHKSNILFFYVYCSAIAIPSYKLNTYWSALNRADVQQQMSAGKHLTFNSHPTFEALSHMSATFKFV